MPPTIHCIRHAQGFHNLLADYTLPDPSLTPHGERQCLDLKHASFPDQSQISLVTASPLSRTLHSASTIFQPALSSSKKCHPSILALPDAQETSDDKCDTGSDPHVLRKIAEERNWPVDLDLVHESWNVKTLQSRYSPHSEAIRARARDARLLLRRKIRELVEGGDDDVHVVLVSHGGFLHYFTEDWEDADRFPGTGWRNCEEREYCFEGGLEGGDEGEARLVETVESRRRREKTGDVPGREEQDRLFTAAMEGWEKHGLQRPDRLGEAAAGCAIV